MAVIILHQGEAGKIRPGDTVFNLTGRRDFPLHVGVYTGPTRNLSGENEILQVIGLPGRRRRGEKLLGVAQWGTPGEYRGDLIGQRLNVHEANVNQIALISTTMITEQSQLGAKCLWDDKEDTPVIDRQRRTLDGIPRFIRGTCAQLVEHLYDAVGLDIIEETVTFNPAKPNRIYPACQILVFWSANYAFRSAWVPKYEHYPACTVGTARVYDR
jgi:hypothetical protein